MDSKKTRVCIVQPADPCGTVPGGIDTFIRGEINNAPDDIQYSVIGISTDCNSRPVGQWTRCNLRNNSFNFYPVVEHEYTGRAKRTPVIVRYLTKLGGALQSSDLDVLEVHRIETLLRTRSKSLPTTAVLHQNMQALYDDQADILWSKFPRGYFWLEDKLVPHLKSAFCVRSDAAEYYRDRFPNLVDTCEFQPTWADPMQFMPPSDKARISSRMNLTRKLEIAADSHILLSVGRLDAQKNPLLLISALERLANLTNKPFSLLLVGEGPLRDSIAQTIEKAGLSKSVHLLGVKSMDEVVELLHAADLFVMSSAYEGMPMAVIEALACGVPVATTQVGEVGRVVHDKICGRIVDEHSAGALAESISWCLDNLDKITGKPCTDAASAFSPGQVLEPIYENYRKLAAQARA